MMCFYNDTILSFYQSIFLSIYLFIFLSIYLSFFIYKCIYIYVYCLTRYRPDLLPWESLDPECAEDNLQLGFDILEAELGLQPVITASEVIL